MSALVELRSVTKRYSSGSVPVVALFGVDLSIAPGEFTAIAGPSGSGKSTLLNLIGCMDTATSGSVELDGRTTGSLSDRERTSLRNRVLGFIFQSYNLIPAMTVFQNVQLPLLLAGGHSRAARTKAVQEALDRVGIGDLKDRRERELSGGQRQRVAIARALINRPRLILADEPTANLDSKTASGVIDLMKELNAGERTTFIFSTHDPAVLSKADRIIRLLDGRVESGAAPS
jgi:putative ABC transport system ATP-binding protein